MYKYNYKTHLDKWWYEVKTLDDFKNVSFPKESALTDDLLGQYSITRYKYIPPEPPKPPEPPVPTLDEVKEKKIKELNLSRYEEESKSIGTDKGVFEFDGISRERITNVMAVLQGTTDFREWTTADGVVVSMTWSDFNNLYVAAAERSDICFDKYQTLKAMVNACTTVEDVDKINWDIINY